MTVVTANAVTVQPKPITELSSTLGTVYTREQIAELVATYSIKYGVDYSKMMHTIECESNYKNVQSSLYSNGIREDSWGIAQINLYWNNEVRRSQALEPKFAVEYMANAFSQGRASRWSCYRSLYQ